jgi:phage shock protein A
MEGAASCRVDLEQLKDRLAKLGVHIDEPPAPAQQVRARSLSQKTQRPVRHASHCAAMH